MPFLERGRGYTFGGMKPASTEDENRTKVPPAVERDRFDAVLFDLDGVLTSTAAIHAGAWKHMFDAFLRARDGEAFKPFDADADYKRYVDGKPRYDGVKSFLEARGIDLPVGTPSDPASAATVCGLGNRKDALVKEAIDAGRVQPFLGSVQWVRALKDRGFRLAVVSSSKNCGQVLRAARIDHLFEARVDGETLDELGMPGKPAPDSFLKAAELLGVPPERAVVVEDAISGVEAGRAGHFGLVIGVDREGHGELLRRHGADVVVRDLGELVQA